MFSIGISLLEEADPYSPQTLYGEESEKPVSREVFVAKTSRKKPALHSIKIEHTPRSTLRKATWKGNIERTGPELNQHFREAYRVEFGGWEEQEKRGLSGLFGAVLGRLGAEFLAPSLRQIPRTYAGSGARGEQELRPAGSHLVKMSVSADCPPVVRRLPYPKTRTIGGHIGEPETRTCGGRLGEKTSVFEENFPVGKE